jgi:hypothetical protein
LGPEQILDNATKMFAFEMTLKFYMQIEVMVALAHRLGIALLALET